MHNVGTARMTRCTIANNETFDDDFVGGGISNMGGLTLVDSLVTNNRTAGDAGGIFNDGGSVTLDHSIVSENKAPAGIGGGIYNTDGKITLIHGSSITGNEASPDPGNGGGIFNDSELDLLDTAGGSIT